MTPIADFVKSFVKKHQEGLLYLICGAGTVFVSWGTYALFVWLGIEVNVSNVLSWVCGVSFAFVLNKWVVFDCRSTEGTTLAREIGSFFIFRIATGVVAIVAFPVLYNFGMGQPLFGVDGFIAKIAVSVIEIVLNYFASKFVVFRKKKDDA
ncbi:MAG: GtrA family protein [Methanomassiliicoccaceae archaeon]|nr:GtrA family protein [Methanomassiliicoccaceae archaeon]